MTCISDLRNRVTLLKRHVLEKEDGSFTQTWQEGDTVWAQVLPYGPQESPGEGWNSLTFTPMRYKVTMRLRTRGFERVRLHVFGERIITLALLCSPVPDQQRKWLTCFMYEVGDDDE